MAQSVRAVVAAPCLQMSKTVWARSMATAGHIKHKTPKKRASSLLNTLQNENFEEVRKNRQWPAFVAGDAIEVKRLSCTTSTEAEILKGVVIARHKRGLDTSVTIANVEYGTPIIRQIKIFSPLVTDVKILEKAFIHNGKKRVRRSKIYYLLDRDPVEYTVK